jgi:uncharacterized protein YoxC
MATATIDSLNMQITSDVTSALEKLKQLKEAVHGVGEAGKGLSSLQKLNEIKIQKRTADSISTIMSAINNIQVSSGTGKALSTLATGLAKLDGVKFSKSAATNLAALVTNLNSADKVKPIDPQVAKNLDTLYVSLAKFKSVQNVDFSGISKLSGLGKTTVNVDKSTRLWDDWRTKLVAVGAAIKVAGSHIGSWINESNAYVENLNLFRASMGDAADEALEFAEKVQETMGIDASQWIRNQGVFQTLLTGFGVAGDKAAVMSQQITQLGYDLSSFYNTGFEDSFQKLQSGLAGELEPLRRFGYDLSVARLQQEAYTLGIDKSVSSMTQAEKVMLRYHAIMTQVTVTHGDLARTIQNPANQFKILNAQITLAKRALGNVLIPIINAALPYVIALAKAVRLLANSIAGLLGFSLPEIDYSSVNTGLGGAVDATDDIKDNMGGAADNAKKMRDYVMGIDELNIIAPSDESSGGGGGSAGGAGGGGAGFDIPIETYDFLAALSERSDELVEKMKTALEVIVAIGLGFATWKIAKGVTEFLQTLSSLKGFNLSFASIGGLGLLSDLNEFIKYFKDFMDNGATFQNVAGMISEFAGMIGDSMIILGNLKIGGALKVVQGIGEIVIAIKDIAENGVNWDNANTAIRGLTNMAIGIGVFTGNLKLDAWGLVIQGFTAIITEISNNWEAIKQGDWSGVDKVTLIIGALEVLGGLAIALDLFSKLKEVVGIGKSAEVVKTVSDATGGLDATVSTSLSPNLTSLAKNLGMGILIIAEVAAAALLITGAIILLGKELEQVGLAWQPVIDNGDTVVTAIELGTVLLVGIGVVTGLLGSEGTLLIINIALGTAILAELGIAAGLFLVEIWAIGKGLDEIGKAWKPVLDNGTTIATGIELGTALLVGIGVVTAALGVATVASAGLLPLAIGLGTALLVELAAATILFIESIVAVAKELGNNLAPVLNDLNGKLPGLTDNMSDFVDFMTVFAGEVVRYTGVSAISGLAATIDTIIGWFTQDPIKKMSKDVGKIAGQTKDLNDKLNEAVPELETAVDLLEEYVDFLGKLGEIAGEDGTVALSEGLKANLNKVGQNIVTGFNAGVTAKYVTTRTIITTWGKDVKTTITSSAFGNLNKKAFEPVGKDIVDGVVKGINSTTIGSLATFGTNLTNAVKNLFPTNTVSDIGKTITTNITSGINGASVGSLSPYGNNLVSAVKALFPETTVKPIGKTLVDNVASGINGAAITVNTFGTTLKTAIKNAVPTSDMESVGKGIASSIITGIKGNGSTTGLKASLTSQVTSAVNAIKNIHIPTPHISKSGSSSMKVGDTSVSIPSFSAKWYERGGFPDAGELFFANESGNPEFVGSMGGKTAVANNDQIIAGVASGVSMANEETNNILTRVANLLEALNDKDVTVNLDGRQVSNGLAAVRREQGVSIVQMV